MTRPSIVVEPQRVFVALAGGGAKGLIHVGALRALEDRGVAFCGLAGTSAGAIVAGLKAAGFSSRELLDTDGGPTLIDQLSEIDPDFTRATDIFGQIGWARVMLFRWASGHSWIVKLLAIALGAAIPAGLIIAGTTRSTPIIVGAALLVVVRAEPPDSSGSCWQPSFRLGIAIWNLLAATFAHLAEALSGRLKHRLIAGELLPAQN